GSREPGRCARFVSAIAPVGTPGRCGADYERLGASRQGIATRRGAGRRSQSVGRGAARLRKRSLAGRPGARGLNSGSKSLNTSGYPHISPRPSEKPPTVADRWRPTERRDASLATGQPTTPDKTAIPIVEPSPKRAM